MPEAVTSMSSADDQIVKTLKAYRKLCEKTTHRPVILKDATFLTMLTSLLTDEHVAVPVITCVVKILLQLTETKDDAVVLSAVSGFEAAVGKATEMPYSPSILHNLLVISSRIQTAKTQIKAQPVIQYGSGDSQPLTVDNGGTLHRKFVSRKSKQLVYEFDELTEELKADIERKILAKKGVISIYFDMGTRRAVLRTVLTIDAQEITEMMFDCGCDMVTQIVRVDGVDEHFKMYASERKQKVPIALPDYLDDMMQIMDPNSCVVTNDYPKQQGWFSSISSFVKGSIW